MSIKPVNKQDVINRIRLEIDGHLETLHKAIQEDNQEQIQASKHELSVIHDTLVALGHWEAHTPIERVPVEA